MPLHIETPLVASDVLGRITGRRILLKLEALQPPGSFKIRGIGHLCERRQREGARRFISSSGGNAGLAVAYAGRHLQVPVVVVVPGTTAARAVSLLEAEGAKVVVHGDSWQEANALAQSMLEPSDAFIHPFDDPGLWSGHASMIDEAARQGPRPDAVLLSVGGGGLMCGVIEGMDRNGWSDVPVLAVETEGAASLRAAIDAGKPVELDRITSIATSLGAKRVCDQALAHALARPLRSLVVTDRAAVSACERFLDDHRLLVEPACGASLALAYDASEALAAYETVLVIVCGGATTTAARLQELARSV
jgi:L-serine/L-threonine ammonia-lyase